MAITTLDGVIAGMQQPQDVLKVGRATVAGRFYSPFYEAGRPGAATAPSPGLSGAALTSYTGSIPYINPASGNAYIARFAGSCSAAGTLILCDRLWHNSGVLVTSTASQTVNSATWPSRDSTGTTFGENIMIGAEVSTTMGAGTPTWTMVYKNASDVTSTITTGAQTATMGIGSFIPIQLDAGSTGVRQVLNWTQSATMTSGVYHLVAYRMLCRLDLPLANVGCNLDAIATGFVRCFNNTVLFSLWLPNSTTAPVISAQVIMAHG